MVERVRSDPAIHIQDLEWICAALDIKVRCTIRGDVHEKMRHAFPDLPQDMLFGKPLLEDEHVQAHLFFSWAKDITGTRDMGHFDILIPSTAPVFAMELPQDVSWIQMYAHTHIYIFIYGFVYIQLSSLFGIHIFDTNTHIYIYVCIFVHIHTLRSVFVCGHIYIYTHIYIYI